jgi:hypothetical protein
MLRLTNGASMVAMNEGSLFPIIDLAPATATQIAPLRRSSRWFFLYALATIS